MCLVVQPHSLDHWTNPDHKMRTMGKQKWKHHCVKQVIIFSKRVILRAPPSLAQPKMACSDLEKMTVVCTTMLTGGWGETAY